MASERSVTVEAVIACPPEVVFDFVTHPANDPRWCPSVSDVVVDGSGRDYHFVQHVGPLRHRERARIVEARRPEGVRWRFTAMGSRVEGVMELVAEGGATRVTQTSRIDDVGRLRWPIQRRIAERELSRQLAILKALLEEA